MNEYLLYNQECIQGMKQIKDESVDLILTDPPYGTIKGLISDSWDYEKTKWDVTLDTSELLEEYSRILKYNGRIILFSQEPYTRNLRSYKNAKLIRFNYPMI